MTMSFFITILIITKITKKSIIKHKINLLQHNSFTLVVKNVTKNKKTKLDDNINKSIVIPINSLNTKEI